MKNLRVVLGEGGRGQKLEEGPNDQTALQGKFGDLADVAVSGDNALLKVALLCLL